MYRGSRPGTKTRDMGGRSLHAARRIRSAAVEEAVEGAADEAAARPGPAADEDDVEAGTGAA